MLGCGHCSQCTRTGTRKVRDSPTPSRPGKPLPDPTAMRWNLQHGSGVQRGYYGFRGVPGHEFLGEVVVERHRSAHRQGRVVGARLISHAAAANIVRAFPAPFGTRTVLLNRSASCALRRIPDIASCDVCALLPDTTFRRSGRYLLEPVVGHVGSRGGTDSSRLKPVAVFGRFKLGLLMAASARRAKVLCFQFGRHLTNCESPNRRAFTRGVTRRTAGAGIRLCADAAFLWSRSRRSR